MANVFDVSSYFVMRGVEEKFPITQISLQKLLYFAQGFHLAYRRECLFADKIYAWKFGPVVRTVFDQYRVFGRQLITPDSPHLICMGGKLPGNRAQLTAENQVFLEDIWATLGKKLPFELVQLTHKKGSPWHQVYREHEGQIPHDTEITPAAMLDYFSKYAI